NQAVDLVGALKDLRSGTLSGLRRATASRSTVKLIAVPAVPAAPPADPTLLALFQNEVETNSATLLEGFKKLEGTPADAELLAELRRAAHSLKGAARIVGMDPLTGVALAMEETLTAAVDGKSPLDAAKLSALRAGTELAGRIGAFAVISGGDIPALSAE